MNYSPDRNLPLYQTIKNSDPPPLFVNLSPHTLQSCIETITDVSLTQQTKVAIVFKPLQSQNWSEIIINYQRQSNLDTLYLCGDSFDISSKVLAEATVASTKTVPVILDKNSRFKRETFWLVIADNFYGLVLAQWQKGQINVNASGKRVQQPYLETIISFEPSLIQQFVLEITSAIAANNPDINLKLNNVNLENSVSRSQIQLLTNLISKQLIKEDALTNASRQQVSQNITTEDTSLVSGLGLKTDFLRNLVEEMRSPITYMKTTIRLLCSKQIKGEQRQRYLQMLENQCDRQNAVISGLLDLLQLDISTEANTIYLNEFVPGIVSTYQPLANENNIQLGYTIPANLPPVIFPASWLRQIIIQLLNNSLQFTPPEGKVFVQAGLKNNNVELNIGDTGRGIEARELSKVFDSFYRTKTVSNDGVNRAGLGLTIVHQLIEKGGGEIFVTSKPGKGSVFRILIPALPQELL